MLSLIKMVNRTGSLIAQLEDAERNPDRIYQLTINEYFRTGNKYHLHVIPPLSRNPIVTLLRKALRVSRSRRESKFHKVHRVGLIKGRDAEELANYVENRSLSDGLGDLPDVFLGESA